MNIFFQSRNLDLNEDSKRMMAQRMYGLDKFFSVYAKAFVNVEKTRASHHGHDLYYTSIHIEDGQARYFTEDYKESVRKSFDHSYGEIFRIIRDERSKSRTLTRKAGKVIKNIFKRGR